MRVALITRKNGLKYIFQPFPFQDGPLGYQPPTNGIGSQMMSNTDPLSSDAVTAAMSAVRQQMCNMVAAAQQHHPEGNNVIGGFHLPSHLSVHPNISIPKLGSPENLTPTKSSTPIGSQHIGSPPAISHIHSTQSHKSNNSQHFSSSGGGNQETLITPRDELCHSAGLSITRLASPSNNDAHDLRIISPEVSPRTSPASLLMDARGSDTSHFRPGGGHFSADHDALMHERNPRKKSQSPNNQSLVDSYKDTPIKIEADCRGE